MDSSGLSRAMGNALAGMIVVCVLGGVLIGACGTCAVQKASGYRIRIERAPAPSASPPDDRGSDTGEGGR